MCSVPSCTSALRRKVDNLSWHGFSRATIWAKQREKWESIIRTLKSEPYWVSTKKSKICSRHFRPQDLSPRGNGKKPNPNAIPTLCLHPDNVTAPARPTSPLPDSELSFEALEEFRAGFYVCEIAGCTTAASARDPNISWHGFPAYPERRKERWKWNQAVQKSRKDKKWFPNPLNKLCSIHFEPNCFSPDRKVLLPSAVPTLFLNEGDETEAESSNPSAPATSDGTWSELPQLSSNVFGTAVTPSLQVFIPSVKFKVKMEEEDTETISLSQVS